MDRKRIDYEFLRLKEAFPEARITAERRLLHIPSVLLPSKFNLPSTPVLVELYPLGEAVPFQVPVAYVSNKLRVYRVRPPAFLTPTDANMAALGWFQLCWANPPPAENLRTFVASLILYLKEF